MDSVISVIVPVYKVERYLNKCIDSILNQTYRNLEIILVDDGSPDNCGRLCDRYAVLDSRVKVIHKENGGLSDARNAGLDIAKGDYIAFVDSDDYIDREMLQRLYDAMVDNNADMSICSIQMVDEHEKQIGILPVIPGIYTGMQIIEEYDYFHGAFVVAWNKLYKRAVFENLRYDVGKIHEDEFIFHKIFAQCQIVVCIDCAYYYYLQRKGSIMAQRTQLDRMHQIEALENRIVWLQKNSLVSQSVYRAVFELSRAFYQFHSMKTCRNLDIKTMQRQYAVILKRQLLKDRSLKHKVSFILEWICPGSVYWITKRKQR